MNGGAGREALNPKEEYVPERVEAKTDVVRCMSFYLYPLDIIRLFPSSLSATWFSCLIQLVA
jgi:hypothetical protein